MNRKEFLLTIWTKYLRPLFLVGLIFFSARFLLRILTQDGAERSITVSFLVLILGLILVVALLSLTGYLFLGLTDWIKSKLSEHALDNLRAMGKVINYLMTIAAGMLIYYMWQRDGTWTIVFFGVFISYQMIEMFRREKAAIKLKKQQGHNLEQASSDKL